jgi:hypothetical protein
MALTPGTKLGPYEIRSPREIGKSGTDGTFSDICLIKLGRKTLVANKIVLKSKELTSIALTCLTLPNFHEVSRAGGPE